MTQDKARLTLFIEKREDMDSEEHTQLVRALMIQLKNQDVESIVLERDQVIPSEGAKGDPLTIGALVVIVAQAVFPKVMEFLQAWSMRGQGQVMKLKIQRGKESVELEYPGKLTPDEVKAHVEALTNELWQNSKHI